MAFDEDAHWRNIASAIAAHPHQRAVVDGRVFFLNRAQPRAAHPEWLGFGGTWHEFHFADGRCVISNDVVHNGSVTPQWRSTIPDNATLLRASREQITHE
jgi:hypothetical protein